MSDSPSMLARRAAALEDAFRVIERTRMRGLPMLHPGLQVEALGFAPLAHAEADAEPLAFDGKAALGILITPWFMNLILLPLDDAPALAVGRVRACMIGGARFEFIGAHEESFGAYAICSLFSPMFEFADHAAARATAEEVLKMLRTKQQPPEKDEAPAIPSRRAFLTGRVKLNSGAGR
jgi:[NiFe] hydrogenase assembly HybE family chaperone